MLGRLLNYGVADVDDQARGARNLSWDAPADHGTGLLEQQYAIPI